jgi:hypothetical protein
MSQTLSDDEQVEEEIIHIEEPTSDAIDDVTVQ